MAVITRGGSAPILKGADAKFFAQTLTKQPDENRVSDTLKAAKNIFARHGAPKVRAQEGGR